MREEHVVYTLVDITDTCVNNPRGSTTEFRQAQNLNSLIQVLSMRTQPLDVRVTSIDDASMDEYDFGTLFKDKQTVWCVTFTTDTHRAWASNDHQYTHLINDCNNVPVYIGLDETISLEPASFATNDTTNKNISFI